MTKLAILTTETLHHAHFVRELAKLYPDLLCVLESTSIRPSFETAHPFEQQREEYEIDYFFGGRRQKISDYAGVKAFDVINQPEAVKVLKEYDADVVITFGTRKIGAAMMAACKKRIINLHGGDPERYRGLDSHLWAIYHGDYSAVTTTLHVLNETLDDGQIIGRQALDLGCVANLSQLRSVNTDACIFLCLEALAQWECTGKILSTPQIQVGRYYSFMPAVLKQICVKKYENFKS